MEKEIIPKLKALSRLRFIVPPREIAEIRLRAEKPAVLVSLSGKMTVCAESFSAGEINDIFAEICRYSVYSFQREIAEGFVTLSGGCRVGIGGTAVYKDGKIDFIKDISSLNIRIAREKIGCSDEIFYKFFKDEPRSLLLGGEPLSGKTTVLRDLARNLSKDHRVSVIDSRFELSGMENGRCAFDLGLNTDVICGAEKSDGIMMALRTLSPEIIICDEIGRDEKALEQCGFCGVKIIASAHAKNFEELEERSSTKAVLPLFDCAAIINKNGLWEYKFLK